MLSPFAKASDPLFVLVRTEAGSASRPLSFHQHLNRGNNSNPGVRGRSRRVLAVCPASKVVGSRRDSRRSVDGTKASPIRTIRGARRSGISDPQLIVRQLRWIKPRTDGIRHIEEEIGVASRKLRRFVPVAPAKMAKHKPNVRELAQRLGQMLRTAIIVRSRQQP